MINTFENRKLSKYLEQVTLKHKAQLIEIIHHGISVDLTESIKSTVISSYVFSQNLIKSSAKPIIYKDYFSLFDICLKNSMYCKDLDIFEISAINLSIQNKKISNFEALGWVYLFELNEKIIYECYSSVYMTFPESNIKNIIDLGLRTKGERWLKFNHLLNEIKIGQAEINEILLGINQASDSFFKWMDIYVQRW